MEATGNSLLYVHSSQGMTGQSRGYWKPLKVFNLSPSFKFSDLIFFFIETCFSSIFRRLPQVGRNIQRKTTVPDTKESFPVKSTRNKRGSNRKWLSSLSQQQRPWASPQADPRDKNVFAFIGGGGGSQKQQEQREEVRWGSLVTGNKSSITKQFSAVNNCSAILLGHPAETIVGASFRGKLLAALSCCVPGLTGKSTGSCSQPNNVHGRWNLREKSGWWTLGGRGWGAGSR